MAEEKPKKQLLAKNGTSLAYYLMEFCFRLSATWNAVPFTYNKKTRRFTHKGNSLKYKLWFFFMLFAVYVELGQVTFELIQSAKDPTMTKGDSGLILFIFLSWVFISSLHYNVFKRANFVVNYLNQVLRIREYFTEDKLPYTSDHKIVRAHLSTSVLQCIAQCLLVATEGIMGKRQYLYSNIPMDYRSPFTAGMWVIYAYYRVISNFLTGYFNIYSGVLHVMTCNQILRYRNTTNMTLDEEVKTYRMLQLLNNRYNEANSRGFLPVMTGFAAANIILGNYGTLRFFGTMDFDKYMNFPLMASMMMVFAFTFYPNNATVKETTDYEQNRMRWSNVQMSEAVLKKVNSSRRRKLESLVTEVEFIQVIPNEDAPRNFPPSQEVQMHDIDSPEGVKGSEATTEPTSNLRKSKLNPGKNRGLDVARQIRMKTNLKKLKLYVLSCPIVGVQMGSFYSIKSSTVLTIFDFIACNTITALLTW